MCPAEIAEEKAGAVIIDKDDIQLVVRPGIGPM